MKFTTKEIGAQPEILKRKLGGELFASVSFNHCPTLRANGFIPAGALIGTPGECRADGGEDGVLLNDVHSGRPNGTIIKAFANVSLTAIRESFERPIAQEIDLSSPSEGRARQAFPLIVFED